MSKNIYITKWAFRLFFDNSYTEKISIYRQIKDSVEYVFIKITTKKQIGVLLHRVNNNTERDKKLLP